MPRRTTLVTVEEITEGDLLADDRTAAGTIPALYVIAIAEARRGAWPVGLRQRYPADLEHLRRYAELARDEAGFARYLDEFVLERVAGRMIDYRPEELLIDVLAGMLDGPRSRRGRRRLADSGRRGVPRARALGRAPARLGPGQRAAQPVHRRRRRAVRLRRAGADRRLLPGRRPDRRRGQHQPRRRRRLPATAGCAGRARSAPPTCTSWCRG